MARRNGHRISARTAAGAAALAGLVLAGCAPESTLVEIVNGCGDNVRALVADPEHAVEHKVDDFRWVSPDASEVFVVPVGPDDEIQLMIYDIAADRQENYVISLRDRAIDGEGEHGEQLRVVTFTGAECPAQP